MIVKCPSCQARFAVENRRVETVSRLRFQCSHCGHYFEAQLKTSSTSPIKLTEQMTKELCDNLPYNKPVIKRQVINDLPAKTSIVGHSLNIAHGNVSYGNAGHVGGAEAIATGSMVTFEQRGAVVEKHFLPSFTSNVACWPSSNAKPAITEDFYIDTNYLKPNISSPGVANFNKDTSSRDRHNKRVHDDSSWVLGDLNSDGTLPSPSFKSLSNDFNVNPKTKEIITKKRKKNSILTKRAVSMPALLVVSVPVIFCLSLLSVANYLEKTPSTLNHVFSIHDTNTPHVPPIVGLEISDIQSNLVTLDDGKSVLEITGKLFNASPSSFKDTRIQVRLFDKQNSEITSIVAPLSNELQKATAIQPLKISTINSLQQHQSSGETIIKPNENHQVKMIVTDNLQQTTWFSLRVYSVKSE